MQGLETLMQVQMTQQIIKLLNSMQPVTIGGLSLEANLKTRVQVVANSPQENLNSDKQNQQQSQHKGASQDAKASNRAGNSSAQNLTNQAKSSQSSSLNNTQNLQNSARGPLANSQVLDAKLAAANAQNYKVVLKLLDGRNISVNLPKPLPVGAKLELVMTTKDTGVLRPLANADKSVVSQQSQGQSVASKVTLNQAQLHNLLNQSLSKVLPKQMPLTEFLKQLQDKIPKVTTQTNLPRAEKMAIRQSLQQIMDHFPKKNNSPPSAQDVKNAIKNNGTLFEAKLAELANFSTGGVSPVATSSTSPANNIPIDLKFLLQRASILLQNSMMSANNQPRSQRATTGEAFTRVPLNISQPLAQATTQAGTTQTGAQAAGAQQSSQAALAQSQAAGTQGAQAQAQTPSQAGQAQTSEVLQQVTRLLDSAMAKIQTQQHSSLQQSNMAENRAVTQNLQVSIPFFANGSWQNIDLELNKLEPDSNASGASSSDKNQKIWQVTLNFDLQDWGRISTRLVLRGESLRADLWLESDEKKHKMQLASESLAARLRSIGAEVEKISCHTGALKLTEASPASDKLIDTRV